MYVCMSACVRAYAPERVFVRFFVCLYIVSSSVFMTTEQRFDKPVCHGPESRYSIVVVSCQRGCLKHF